MSSLRNSVVVGVGGAVCVLGAGPPARVLAAEPEVPKEIIAAQIRDQGYACERPLSAERDQAASRPDEAAWVLRCENAAYRVRLIPDMAAKVERIE